ARLRPGNVHSADGWEESSCSLSLTDAKPRGRTVVVRADAAFALPALYEALERRGVAYAIRLPANDVLERAIEDLLTPATRAAQPRPAGPLPELPLSGRVVGSASAGDRQGRAALGRALPSSRLHCHHAHPD